STGRQALPASSINASAAGESSSVMMPIALSVGISPSSTAVGQCSFIAVKPSHWTKNERARQDCRLGRDLCADSVSCQRMPGVPAREVAERQIALAGIRLAHLLIASVSLPKAVAEHDLDFFLSNPPRSHRRYTDLSWSACYSHLRTELRYCLNSSPNLAARARSSGSI